MSTVCSDKCNKCSSYMVEGIPCVQCSNGSVCEEIYYSSCVIYNNDYLECYGVKAGDTLTEVIDKLLDLIYKDCTTTSTSTSTTTTAMPTTTSTTTLFKICNDCP